MNPMGWCSFHSSPHPVHILSHSKPAHNITCSNTSTQWNRRLASGLFPGHIKTTNFEWILSLTHIQCYPHHLHCPWGHQHSNIRTTIQFLLFVERKMSKQWRQTSKSIGSWAANTGDTEMENMTGNVRIIITMRRFGETFVAVEKQ
jgi:hypothetical protein